jgi:hypothetical protein
MHPPETRRGGPAQAASSDTQTTGQQFSTAFGLGRQADLFDDAEMIYPFSPGAKESRLNAASRKGAETIAPDAKSARAEVFATFLKFGPQTADEVAQRIGQHILMVRPRVAECVRMGLLKPTEQRRPSSRGLSSTVWSVVSGAAP